MEFRTYTGGFRKLIAWQKAHTFTLEIYKVTASFPANEKYGITSQLRRAASSIGAQITEGSRMPTPIHRKLYYDRAYASAAEVDNFLELAKDLGLLAQDTYVQLLEKLNRMSYLVHQLSNSCISNAANIH
jgi:four helix bundle protein